MMIVVLNRFYGILVCCLLVAGSSWLATSYIQLEFGPFFLFFGCRIESYFNHDLNKFSLCSCLPFLNSFTIFQSHISSFILRQFN